jgi:hypothetical protein
VGEPRIQWQRFVRIRVDIDLTSPLSPGFFLPRYNHQDLWIGLKYERLPGMCYRCSVIGHDTRDCVRDEKMLWNEFCLLFLAYGHWIRTENAESPPGIYARPPCNAIEAMLTPPHLTGELDQEACPIVTGEPCTTTSEVCPVIDELDNSSVVVDSGPKDVAPFARLLEKTLMGSYSTLSRRGPNSKKRYDPLRLH